MLQVKGISKKYRTGELIQDALDNVSVNLRDNEFVAVLGPSGSGKTTLLNMIGGLDRYDSGDLIINGISTKKYQDRDWDSYRNHTIGFVFQSYNLIPHQSILANVELALTISGISKSQRRQRAKKALADVGLADQLHKKPNQMSGGQMQRVAIARALVNNPSILLADEPTGALDTETGTQVMELLKEVAKDRLVIMVTHNPELAHAYANRIVMLKDGKIIEDSNPYLPEGEQQEGQHKRMGKASMSFFTALSLSFNNLRTKKARTILTAFAGSIGIIGIALILSMSTGVNAYIEKIQKDTMTSYPITIEEQAFDLSGMMGSFEAERKETEPEEEREPDRVYSNGRELESANKMMTSVSKNNLTAFKKYLDDPNCELQKHVGENGIVYSYDVRFGVYARDPEGVLVRAKSENQENMAGMMSMMGGSLFTELLPGQGDSLVSPALTDNYEMLYGQWPQNDEQVVLVVNQQNEISITTLFSLGLLPSSGYRELMKEAQESEEFKAPEYNWTYDEICKTEFFLVPACDFYERNEDGTFKQVGNEDYEMEMLADKAIKLKVSGVIRAKDDKTNATINGIIGYTNALTNRVIAYANSSDVVKAQLEKPSLNVLNNVSFDPADDAAKIEDVKAYFGKMGISEKASTWKSICGQLYATQPEQLEAINKMDETMLAASIEEYLKNPDDTIMLTLYDRLIFSGSYEDNLDLFGYVSVDAPSSINIYADSFEAKDAIADSIKKYNEGVAEEDKIAYTDFVALLMSSVTTIVNVISYVLIAFVAVSLIVSSLMIGIITYISVLERKKEIGILRAIGASKRNISQVFSAETFIVGLLAGLIGVGVSMLLLIPGNIVIHLLTDTKDISAFLPIPGAIILVVLSIFLTLIGGFIPSKKAARKDPVEALRSE